MNLFIFNLKDQETIVDWISFTMLCVVHPEKFYLHMLLETRVLSLYQVSV